MMKAWLLRLHRWVALAFTIPLLVVVVTGLILSFQPIESAMAIKPGSLSAERLESLIRQYDPEGKARALSIDHGADVLTLEGVGDEGAIDISLKTGEEIDDDEAPSDIYATARRLHQRLVFRMGWLVIASSFAMLALAALGLFMGFSRVRNNLSGWHKLVAWTLFPLVVLSPLTGLFLAFNITFAGDAARPAARSKPPALLEATRMVDATVDPSRILSIGPRGGAMLARVSENGEARAYSINADGLVARPRNWPRLIHEGNWSTLLSGVVNIVTSIALLALLMTGVIIWARREWRRRAMRRVARPRRGAEAAGAAG